MNKEKAKTTNQNSIKEDKAPEYIIEAASKGLSSFLKNVKENNKNEIFTTNDFQFYSYITIRIVENLYKELTRLKENTEIKNREEENKTFTFYNYFYLLERPDFVKYSILKSIEESTKQNNPKNVKPYLVYELCIKTLLSIEESIKNR